VIPSGMADVYKTRMERLLVNVDISVNDHQSKLTLRQICSPSYNEYRDLHDRVGSLYGWDKRERIKDRRGITNLLSLTGVELWLFLYDAEPIGYSLITCAEDKTVELEDFGFFPEFCNRGYGQFLLSKMLERMKALGMEKVWLTSRSSNHSKVVPFYQKAGFIITDRTPVVK